MSPTILVVDDEEFLRQAIGFDYELRGFNVLLAANGREAFEIVQREKVDLILTDVRMPNGDGLELLDKVKAHDPALPVVFISGYADLTLEEAFERGVEAVFPKPFDRKALATVVETAIADTSRRMGRRAPRIPAELQVGVCPKSGGPPLKGKVTNLGSGGMFMELLEGLPACEQEVEFRLSLSASGLEIAGRGVVKWVRKDPAGPHPAGCGIEFASLDPQSISLVLELINDSKTKAFVPRS